MSLEQDQVWARHILVADEATALQVLERLNSGEDFATVAAEVSTDTASATQGGDLGWFGIGVMDLEFEKVAFNLPIGTLSQPVSTQFGWHIIQVLGHEVRSIAESDFQQLQDQVFQDWLTAQREAANVQTFDYWQDRVPSDPPLVKTAQ
jgi:parvulin-like peptidyl-prolyl isomerase